MRVVEDGEIATALLEVNPIGNGNRFRNNYNQVSQVGTIFGGQLLAQGLVAAQQTVSNRDVHSCSACFPSVGDSNRPVEFQVEIVRDGNCYANRRITGQQEGKILLDMLCSFTMSRVGLDHQLSDIPQVTNPEELVTEPEFFRAHADVISKSAVWSFTRPFPVEVCTVDAERLYFGKDVQPRRSFWFRVPSATSLTNEAQHNAILAFLADYRLGGVALAPHISALDVERFVIATLNHSMWFHSSARADEWLLYVTECPWTGKGRGLARGSLYSRAGRLVVSAVQELMVGVRS